MTVTITDSQNPSHPTTVTDNDTSTSSTSHTEDNLDGDITVNVSQPRVGKPCGCAPTVPCHCADNGYRDYIYPASGCCGLSLERGAGLNQSTVVIKKSNNTFNFGMAFVPAGYFNSQGGGQGASVTGAQQTVAPVPVVQCCPPPPPAPGYNPTDPTQSGIVNKVTNETFNTYNNNYNNNADNDAVNGEPTVETTVTEGDAIRSSNL